MNQMKDPPKGFGWFLNRINLNLRPKLILIFLLVMVIPIILLTAIALSQINSLGHILSEIAVEDSTIALNDGARESIERLTTDTAAAVADFLKQRDHDALLLAKLAPSDAAYKDFSDARSSCLTKHGEWVLASDGMSWVEKEPYEYEIPAEVSTNKENDDELFGSSFNYRSPSFFAHEEAPLYDEITFIDLAGNEVYKYVNPSSRKVNYPMNPDKVNVSGRMNTYVKAENYFDKLNGLKPGEIYVSDVIGAYVGTNYIGMYAPGIFLSDDPRIMNQAHPNRDELIRIANLPPDQFTDAARKQAYAGKENPVGQRFEGIVRWVTPTADENGVVTGYVTMALNHDHIMEFVDYITPMIERYTELPSAYEGNYAFIWDYKCRSICHPRHHSIVGYNPVTGEPQAPWLEGTIGYERDYENGGFIKDENNNKIPILDAEGNSGLATDTPYYYWYTNGGAEWLAANPSWDSLSEAAAGTSWGQFFAENENDRDILPQFGERVLKDTDGRPVTGENGAYVLDYQSRDKAPAAALTKAGFVGLDGRYLNNAPQCTGWMNLTEHGGSGSFYILWSGIYKPTTAGAIPYYTGQYAPENQNGSKRGFAMVTIGAGIEDFTAPAHEMEIMLMNATGKNLLNNLAQLAGASVIIIAIVISMAILLSSYLTDNIKLLVNGISRFRAGERQVRLHSDAKDEFGELAESFDKMADSIVDSVKEPLSIIDTDHKIIYVNDMALKIIGKELEDVVGTSYDTVSIYPQDSSVDPIAALNENREADVWLRNENGHYYKGNANYLLDLNGAKTGYIIVTYDVTEIEDARLRAEQASHAKGNFLSNMSHEMRTPMNAIIGMTSIGKAANDIEKKDFALQKIEGASNHLLGVINDILDMSKIEANKFTLSNTEFLFNKMFQKVVDVINFRIDEKRQKLTVNIDPAIPDSLIGDEQHLTQVITNLMTNAVKFTPEEGSVHMEAELSSEKDGVCTLLVSIRDTGIGISPEQRSRLFTAFTQAEESTTRKYGGTGLGLVISKNIVEMMNGTMWVDSELGKGSTFSFTVNLMRGSVDFADKSSDAAEPAGAEMQDEHMANFAGHCILLAEDVEINREIVLALLEPTGLEVDCAENGVIAVDMFIKNPSKYGMIFMDLQMPEMDGLTATKSIRESGVPRSGEIPIVAMTANVFKEDIDNCLAAGMDGHVGKPLNIDEVIEKLRTYLLKTNSE